MDIPSIVSDINGCNEIILDGYNGLIVPPKSIMHLFEAMSRIISGDNLYKSMCKNARQSVEERYNQDDVWKALHSEYDLQLFFKGYT